MHGRDKHIPVCGVWRGLRTATAIAVRRGGDIPTPGSRLPLDGRGEEVCTIAGTTATSARCGRHFLIEPTTICSYPLQSVHHVTFHSRAAHVVCFFLKWSSCFFLSVVGGATQSHFHVAEDTFSMACSLISPAPMYCAQCYHVCRAASSSTFMPSTAKPPWRFGVALPLGFSAVPTGLLPLPTAAWIV